MKNSNWDIKTVLRMKNFNILGFTEKSLSFWSTL